MYCAGKSTTLSILSGVHPPSSGVALIAGHSVESDLSSVYTVLGVCPQADRVWDELSVRQHLMFYARLKGVDRAHERALVQRMAEMVSLDGDDFGKKASQLSGGTRRRLCIAISLIGSPPVWLLDEPTTGLSAEAKREVWDIIAKQKTLGRCVIITTVSRHPQSLTLGLPRAAVHHECCSCLALSPVSCLRCPCVQHSMEEADTLCTRIGIVCNGRLQAVGSQAHLKSKFGDGFKLTLNLSQETDFVVPNPALPLQPQQYTLMQEPIDMDRQSTPASVTRRLLHFIEESIYPSAILSSYNARRLQFILPHPAGHSTAFATTYLPAVLSVFDRMEEFKGRLLKEYRIQEWGLAHASLEEVFINCVRQAEQKASLNSED